MLLVYLLGLLASFVESYPTGAPMHSCTNLLPHHHGTSPQSPPAPYTFSVNSGTYTPGNTLIVSIFGSPEYLAFLIQGQRTDQETPVGSFVEIPVNTRYLSCASDKDSVTHSNTTPRNITQFLWMPPKENVGDIIFKGSVARSRSLYYGVIESQAIKYSKTAPSGSRKIMTTIKDEPVKTNFDGSGSSKPTSLCLPVLLAIVCIFRYCLPVRVY